MGCCWWREILFSVTGLLKVQIVMLTILPSHLHWLQKALVPLVPHYWLLWVMWLLKLHYMKPALVLSFSKQCPWSSEGYGMNNELKSFVKLRSFSYSYLYILGNLLSLPFTVHATEKIQGTYQLYQRFHFYLGANSVVWRKIMQSISFQTSSRLLNLFSFQILNANSNWLIQWLSAFSCIVW